MFLSNLRKRLARAAAKRRSVSLRNDEETLRLLKEQLGDVWYYKQAVKLEVDGLCLSDHCCGFPMALVRSWRKHCNRPGELEGWYPFAACLDQNCNHAKIIADLTS